MKASTRIAALLEVSDLLAGRTSSDFDLGAETLSGDQLAFTAFFEDGTRGIYLATIPEPASALLLAIGLLAVSAGPRSRRRRRPRSPG
jgi:hypothetical protein